MINPIEKQQNIDFIEKNIISELHGKELWGDLNVTLEEYEILRDKLAYYFMCCKGNINSVFDTCPACLTTCLVFLIRYKYDVNFWGLLEKELSIQVPFELRNLIGNLTKKVFKKYGFDYSDVEDDRRINLAPIMYEAGIPPESSLDDLFYVLHYDSHNIFDPQLIIEDLLEARSYQIRKPLLKFLRRYQDDRAVDFLLDVHDAMLSVDQNMVGDSHYVGKYSEWKENKKESIATRKKQEYQTKPYFTFESGKNGFSIVLPRTILKDEWIAEVKWIIDADDISITKTLNVFGDSGARYVDSIVVPVKPAKQYKVALIDNESIEENEIVSWSLNGIDEDETLLFNSNGRLINAHYLQYPYATLVAGNNSQIKEQKNVVLSHQIYPNDNPNYTITTIEPVGRDAYISYTSGCKTIHLIARPQIKIRFEGKTLFSLPPEDINNLFIEIPKIFVEVDEGTPVAGLSIKVGQKELALDRFFSGATAEIPIKSVTRGLFDNYGTYSIKLYQGTTFLKQAEFSYVPNFKSDYKSNIGWEGSYAIEKKYFSFVKQDGWELEFKECVVSSDEAKCKVECPAGVGAVTGLIKSKDSDNSFTRSFELPINPLQITIKNAVGEIQDKLQGKMFKLDLEELVKEQYWVGIECFGEYRDGGYSLRLRTINGIDQTEYIRLYQNESGNIDLSLFYDTLKNCPLPAQIELWHGNDGNQIVKLLAVTDNVQMKSRPQYSRKKNFIAIGGDEEKSAIKITKFGKNPLEITLDSYKEVEPQPGIKMLLYSCPIELSDGLYVAEGTEKDVAFEFEYDSKAIPTNGKDTFYISSRAKDEAVETFSDWLDLLIKNVLQSSFNKDIAESSSYKTLSLIKNYQASDLSELDIERLISLAFFASDKCKDTKKEQIIECMKYISRYVLTASSRLEIVRYLADFDCTQEMFDKCLEKYNLLLCLGGTNDAKRLSEKVDHYSVELSMLLRMGVDDSVRNAVWKEKYRDLIGREAIKELLSVPGETDREVIAEEQKKFFREESPCRVKINLTKELSGDSKPLQDMIEFRKNDIVFNKSKKPDIGIYMDHIRYVDQYVNWYSLSHNRSGQMVKWKSDAMVNLIESECKHILFGISEIRKIPEIKETLRRYEVALESRFDGDPIQNLSVNKYDRYFYVQAMAAFLAMLPAEYRKYGQAIRPAERFMTEAMTIAPRISKRDLIMAKTFIFLMRKEEKICQ